MAIPSIICWTLIHSLWQGLIAALLSAFIMIGTKRSSPAFRYNLLTALFFLLIGAFAATLGYEWQHAGTSIANAAVTRSITIAV